MGVIVVGVDHSKGAKAALEFAVDEARLRPATLRAVHAWSFSFETPGLAEGFFPAAAAAELSDLRSAAEAALEAALDDTIQDFGGIAVERRVIEGTPGAVLVAESQAAELLVVGSRGHGGFPGLLLGSVGAQCAHHAACPVVIIPHRRGG
jgi:nucleotide-binding universal stress UspA family protein